MPKNKLSDNEIKKITSEIRDFLKSVEIEPKEYFPVTLLKKGWSVANPHYFKDQKAGLNNIKAYEILIEEAQESYVHFQLLKAFISDWITLKPENMPDILQRWLCDYLEEKVVPPNKKNGDVTDYQRRLWIAVAAFKVIDKGLPAGKNESSQRKDNAFSIVSEAAHQAGWQGVTYYTVRDYHKKMKHLS